MCVDRTQRALGARFLSHTKLQGSEGDSLDGSYMTGVLSAEAATSELVCRGNGLANMEHGFWGVDDSGGVEPFANSGIRDGTGGKAGS